MESPVSSPFQSVFTSVGPQHEKALKQSFYNTAAFVFVVLCTLITVGAYYVLEIFLRPLIWAALCGTFLYPFKKLATESVRAWLDELQTTGSPFVVGVSALPLTGVNKCVDGLGVIVKHNYKLLISLCIAVPLFYYLLVFQPLQQIFAFVSALTGWFTKLLTMFSNPYAVWTTFIGFAVLLCFYDKATLFIPDVLFKTISTIVWFITTFHLVSLAGTWKVPLAMILLFFVTFGMFGEMRHCIKNNQKKHEHSSFTIKGVIDETLVAFGISSKPSSSPNVSEVSCADDNIASTSNENSPRDSSFDDTKSANVEALPFTPINPPSIMKKKTSFKKVKLSTKRPKKRIGTSDSYFFALFWLFVISRIYIHVWIMKLLPILFVVYILKASFIYFQFDKFFIEKMTTPKQLATVWFTDRKDIILPGFVKRVLKMLHAGDQKVIAATHASMDKLMSAFIILSLVVMVILTGAFFSLQVHHESSYLLAVATDVVNRTVISNQEYLRYLNVNDTDVHQHIDTAVNSAFLYGRSRVSGFVSSAITTDATKAKEITKQVDLFLEQMHDAWAGMEQTDTKKKLKISSKTNTSTEGLFRKQLTKVKELFTYSDLTNLWNIIKDNIQTLQSVLESVWVILKGNMSLVFSVITQALWLVFLSGTYLLNSIISCVIFTTTLFYLLSASSKQYKLVEWLSGVSLGTRLGESINAAITDVFGASLKMAAFYGMYTWLTHSVFGANLVFIPAALAATLGVVPFIGTHWAALPATLELWLIQQQGVLAVSLFALHMLPTYVVDTAIYSEIAGGHPYLTGLAVAGGVYCNGLEGAFMGPIVLCCLIAAFDVYNSIMNANDSEGEGLANTVASAWRWRRRAVSEDRS